MEKRNSIQIGRLKLPDTKKVIEAEYKRRGMTAKSFLLTAVAHYSPNTREVIEKELMA